MDPSSVEKLYEIDSHIGCAASGIAGDAKSLVDHSRVECQNHRFTYNEPLGVEAVTQPGPGVLRIKPAITGLTSETEGVKTYEFIPVAAIYNGFKAAMGWRSKVTQVFLEVDVIDSVSGKSVAAGVRKGTNEQLTQEEVRLSDVRPIVQEWASDGVNIVKTVMSEASPKIPNATY